MNRKRLAYPVLAVALLLNACAGPLPTAVAPQPATPEAVTVQLHWDLPKAPLSPQFSGLSSLFRTQQMDLTAIAKFDVSVTAADLPQAISPSPNPLAVTATSATLTVPAGKNRIFRVRGLDANNVAIAGATIGALADVLGGPNVSVSAGLQATPTALAAQAVLDAGRSDLLATLSATALQSFIDKITVPAGNGASFQFAPGLVNTSAVGASIIANNGVPTDPISSAYRLAGGTVSGKISGLVNGDQPRVSLSDPASQSLTVDSQGNYTITNVAPGTWTLLVDSTFYDQPLLPTVQVTAGQTATGNLTLTPANYFGLETSPGNVVQGQIVRWTNMPVKVFITEPTDGNVQFTDVNRQAVQAAIAAWNSQAGDFLSITQVSSAAQANIQVSWVKSLNGTESGVAAFSTTTGQDLQSTIQLATFDTGGTRLPDSAVKETAIHEFGHALGIWTHSDVTTDIMSPSTDGRINLNISRRDLNTLRQIYSKPAAITHS